MKYWFIRGWYRFIHRYNYHHTTLYGPLEDGRYKVVCNWCGLYTMYNQHPDKQQDFPL